MKNRPKPTYRLVYKEPSRILSIYNEDQIDIGTVYKKLNKSTNLSKSTYQVALRFDNNGENAVRMFDCYCMDEVFKNVPEFLFNLNNSASG